MKVVYIWRWIIVIIITIITVIGVSITLFFKSPYAILIAIGINTLISQIHRLIITPKLIDIEKKQNKKENYLKKFDSIITMISILERYETIKSNDIIEKICTKKFLSLYEELELIGFVELDIYNIEDEKYEIFFNYGDEVRSFYIKDKFNDRMYYSEKYNEETNIDVLNEFINHIKELLIVYRDLKKIIV